MIVFFQQGIKGGPLPVTQGSRWLTSLVTHVAVFADVMTQFYFNVEFYFCLKSQRLLPAVML